MPTPLPPIETRFPVNRKDHTKKGPYLTSFLKRCLKKHITYEDPETQKMIRGKVRDAVIWRLILNATQGETHAIREILDRVDGKVTQPIGVPDSGVRVFIQNIINKAGIDDRERKAPASDPKSQSRVSSIPAHTAD